MNYITKSHTQFRVEQAGDFASSHLMEIFRWKTLLALWFEPSTFQLSSPWLGWHPPYGSWPPSVSQDGPLLVLWGPLAATMATYMVASKLSQRLHIQKEQARTTACLRTPRYQGRLSWIVVWSKVRAAACFFAGWSPDRDDHLAERDHDLLHLRHHRHHLLLRTLLPPLWGSTTERCPRLDVG